MAPPTRGRSEKNEAPTAAAGPAAATPTGRERVVRTTSSVRAFDEISRRRELPVDVPAGETSRAPQRNAPDTRKILMTRLTQHTKS